MPAQINMATPDLSAYAIYEPRTVARAIAPVIKAQVHDALWMLTQQWRVGEFNGDDAGSVIKAKIETQSTVLNRFRSKREDGEVKPFKNDIPLETMVEQLPLLWDLGMQITVGFQWMKILRSKNLSDAIDKSKAVFGLSDDTGNNAQKASNLNASQVRNSLKIKNVNGWVENARIVNGESLVEWFKNNPPPTSAQPINTLSMSASELLDFEEAKTIFLNWFKNTYNQPISDQGISWNDRKFEYEFSVSAPDTTASNAPQTVLLADKYKDGTLDWYSFDRSPTGTSLQESPAYTINNGDVVLPSSVQTYIPHTIEFKGMPKARWWEFEDKNVDLAKMLAQKQDISKLVVMEFGLIYSNDWFVIPHSIPDASLTEVKGLVVTDVFGQQFRVNRAAPTGAGTNWQKWDMYNLSKRGVSQQESYGRLLMAPRLKERLESEPLERVMMLRDEMANMVWGVEEVVPNELMGGMDGKNASNELQKYLAANYTPLVPASYIPNAADHRFQMSNAVPENWIPFIAVNPDIQGRTIMLQRATMKRYIGNDYTDELIKPRTFILSPGIENAEPYFINEEATSKSGFVISTNFQRTRWYGGSTFTWLGHKVQTGRGEGNSGLKFDILTDKEPDAGAADIPNADMSGWWRADAPGNEIVNGKVTVLKDNSGNGTDLTVWNGVAAPDVDTINGLQALNFNNNILLNSSGENPMHEYDNFTIFHVGDAGIGRGLDISTNQWSFRLTPEETHAVLVLGSAPPGAPNVYGMDIPVSTGIKIKAVTLEQTNTQGSGVTAKLTCYDENGGVLPLTNNPCIANRIGLRATTNIGFTMGVATNPSGYSNGHVFETIVYRRKLSELEMKKVLDYLKDKYSAIL